MSSDLLRKWERRYGVLDPGRTVGNQRLYSRVDEARARVMVRHVRDGIAPAQAAELARTARFKITSTPTTTTTRTRAADTQAEMKAALERYDETTAERALDKLLGMSTTTAVIRDVLLPYLHEIGRQWARAHLSIAQEHFASAFIHSRLMGLARGWDRGLGPRALLACPAGEQHTFGLIAFGIALHQIGWRITYLGADTPIATITSASASIQPRLTVISAVVPERLQRALGDLDELRGCGPLALAGAGATREIADRCRARHLSYDPITAAETVFNV